MHIFNVRVNERAIGRSGGNEQRVDEGSERYTQRKKTRSHSLGRRVVYRRFGPRAGRCPRSPSSPKHQLQQEHKHIQRVWMHQGQHAREPARPPPPYVSPTAAALRACLPPPYEPRMHAAAGIQPL